MRISRLHPLDTSTVPAAVHDDLKAFLAPLTLSPRELLAISKGLTNAEIPARLTGDERTMLETEKLRSLGKFSFQLSIINYFRIFQDVRYLSYSEFELNSDMEMVTNGDLIREFMKWNALTGCVSMNSGFLISEFVEKEEFEKKKIHVFKATAVGSFYTMIGIVYANYRDQFDEFMGKVINGKRGIIEIVKSQQA
ncbi:uncharacterized protein LODBEIA_P18000 [Lodderomyces beijingensis]|uniref:Uncharacterized protein n=1 Tax=Lodderomyces beijingensis TaxID=1775926 RepID=A0ABP0ZL11_9ASCO